MNHHDYTEANRTMWNQTAAVHAEHQLPKWLEAIKQPDFNILDATEQAIFDDIGLEGKAVAQLSCNNGRELLSLKNLGAGRCVGFDISDAFIAQGEQLAKVSGLKCEFIQTDIYDISNDYLNSFDIVYVTVGALGWLADLPTYFQIVNRLLRSGGHLFIYEMHPILDMFDAASGLEPKRSYFRTEPYREDASPDYYNPDITVEGTSYWFHHKLSDIIGGCLHNKLNLTHFEEFAHDLSNVYASFEALTNQPPLSYALVAQKRQR